MHRRIAHRRIVNRGIVCREIAQPLRIVVFRSILEKQIQWQVLRKENNVQKVTINQVVRSQKFQKYFRDMYVITFQIIHGVRCAGFTTQYCLPQM